MDSATDAVHFPGSEQQTTWVAAARKTSQCCYSKLPGQPTATIAAGVQFYANHCQRRAWWVLQDSVAWPSRNLTTPQHSRAKDFRGSLAPSEKSLGKGLGSIHQFAQSASVFSFALTQLSRTASAERYATCARLQLATTVSQIPLSDTGNYQGLGVGATLSSIGWVEAPRARSRRKVRAKYPQVTQRSQNSRPGPLQGGAAARAEWYQDTERGLQQQWRIGTPRKRYN